MFNYYDYITDDKFLRDYNEYQSRYMSQARESDKIVIGLVRKIYERHDSTRECFRLLDIGCSTGNLLLHLKTTFPGMTLGGGDLAESSLSACRANPDLQGIDFQKLDLLSLPQGYGWDIITVNAVLYMMDAFQFERALQSVSRALKPGGTIIVFDFFHSFEQDLTILEVSKSHPAGLRLCFRPIYKVRETLVKIGFIQPEFYPFALPIDLPRQQNNSELSTYTVRTTDGERLPFRGTLFQPWCHLTAVRSIS